MTRRTQGSVNLGQLPPSRFRPAMCRLGAAAQATPEPFNQPLTSCLAKPPLFSSSKIGQGDAE
eukprot:3294245-Pyramimonas_sp.AAC.1